MARMRFNHMELTLPLGTLTPEFRRDVDAFFCDVLEWRSTEAAVPGVGDCHLLLPDDGQFILLAEYREPLQSPGWDHLGLLQESREEVDRILGECERYAEKDDRMRLHTAPTDLVLGPVTTHGFYFRYLLPLWFDVQHLDYADTQPRRTWEATG